MSRRAGITVMGAVRIALALFISPVFHIRSCLKRGSRAGIKDSDSA